MPESFYSFVDNLSDDDFASLKKAVARRENIEKYGAAAKDSCVKIVDASLHICQNQSSLLQNWIWIRSVRPLCL